MPNFNTAPYFDDFSVDKDFYQVLFKPGYAVQARELNQLQSILQNQISTVGKHLFKKNTVIIPGGIALNTRADIISITGVGDVTTLLNKTITNAQPPFDVTEFTNFQDYTLATVIAVRAATETEPAALYIQYKNTQSSEDPDGGAPTFTTADNIAGGIHAFDSDGNVISFLLHSTIGATVGKVAHQAAGVFFTKDRFVYTPEQSTIVEVDNKTVTNCTIGLNVTESIVTSYDDESLLDNANGTPNEYAPGADRYKISLSLARIDGTTTINDDNFIRMMDINHDTITYLNDNTQYAELMKTLAHRTFDANGNFVVKGLDPSVTTASDDDYVVANITKGRCYVGGYEYSQIADQPFNIAKPRDQIVEGSDPPEYIYQKLVSGDQAPTDMTYFYVAGDAEVHCTPGNIVQFSAISFNTDIVWVDNPVIGMGIFRGLEFVRGRESSTPSTDLYRLYVDVLSLEKGYTISDVGGIRFTNTPDVGYKAGISVLHELTVVNVTGTFTVGDFMIGRGEVEEALGVTVVSHEADLVPYPMQLTGTFTPDTYTKGWLGWKVEGVNIDADTYVKGATTSTIYLTKPVLGAVTSIDLTNEQLGTIYYVVSDKVYLRKDSFAPIPYDDTVKSYNIGAPTTYLGSGTRKSTFVSNYRQDVVPFIPIDSEPIRSLDALSYRVVRSDIFTIHEFISDIDPEIEEANNTYWFSDVAGSPLSGDDQFSGSSTRNVWGYLPEDDRFVQIRRSVNGVRFDKEIGGQDYSLIFDDDFPYFPGPGDTKALVVYSTVHKANDGCVPKTKTEVVVNIPNPSGSWMSLGNQDVCGVEKVVDGKVINVTAASWDNPSDTATLTATYTVVTPFTVYNHSVGDVVVIKDIVSSANTGGLYYNEDFPEGFTGFKGYNGKHTLIAGTTSSTGAPDGDGLATVTVTLKYTVATDPGSYTSGGTVALKPNINTDTDITDRYRWDSGNTAYYTGTGTIKKRRNSISPVGQIGVQYFYYLMEDSPNDYVSVDSYAPDPYVDLSYISGITDVTDSAGNVIKVRSCLDYRPRFSSVVFKNIAETIATSNVVTLRDLNLSALEDELVDTFIIGPAYGQHDITDCPARIARVSFNPTTGNTDLYLELPDAATGFGASTSGVGTYWIGLARSEDGFSDASGLYHQFTAVDGSKNGRFLSYPKGKTSISYAYTKFLPRKTMLYVDRDSSDYLTVKTEDVDGIDTIRTMVRNSRKLPLAYMVFKPFTLSVNDVQLTKFSMPVYQMVDIDQLAKRLDNAEYNVSLALNRNLEEAALGTGDTVDRSAFHGFWNEDFMNYQNHNYESDDFSCTVYDKAYVAPSTITRTISMDLQTSKNAETWKKTGTSVSLPYKEAKAISNTAASGFSNLNPYNQIQWEGKMMLYPSVDNWVDTSGNPPPVGGGDDGGVQVPFPPIPTDPPYVIPDTPSKEIVTEINIIKASWGPDSSGGKHAITFEWKTSTGRTGRVNTDIHLSTAIKEHGAGGYDGTFAKSLLNKKFRATGVKAYLQAGREFDQKPPSEW